MANDCYNSITVSGDNQDLKRFYELYISQQDGVEDHLDFDKVITLPEKLPRGCDNWDMFRIRVWGTTSGVYDTQISFAKNLNVNFYSAGDPCLPVIKKLIEEHPELSFEFYYEESGMDIRGKISGKDGQITFEEHGEYRSDADEDSWDDDDDEDE